MLDKLAESVKDISSQISDTDIEVIKGTIMWVLWGTSIVVTAICVADIVNTTKGSK